MKVKTSLGFEDSTIGKLAEIAKSERRSVSQIVDITMSVLTPTQIRALMPRSGKLTRKRAAK